MDGGPLRLRDATPEDAPRLLELRARVYDEREGDRGGRARGARGDAGAGRDPTPAASEKLGGADRRRDGVAAWRWKYAGNPAGSLSCVAEAGDEARLVGHVGGIALRTWFRGTERLSAQAVDHMIDPACRRGLKRLGVFARLKRWWMAEHCGVATGDRPRAFFGFGFPSAEDFRIGARVARYELIRPVNALLRRSPRPGAGGARCELDLEFPAAAPAELDALWERCRGERAMGFVRDRQYVGWRYEAHPLVRYALVAAREPSGRLRGVAVVRAGGLADDVATIVDWIAPAADAEARRTLLAGCERLAGDSARGALFGLAAWFPEPQPEFESFQDEGFRVRPTRLVLVGRSFDPAVRMDEIRRDLFMTLGDVDFL